MNDWMKHPGLYRLFELGHVVAADGIREYMFESAGVDTTGASLVSVYSRVPRIEASVIADLDDPLPFPDAALDRVVSVNLIEHLADPVRLLAEIARVLVPDGLAVIVHSDWDTMLFTGSDDGLTRRLVDRFVSAMPGWAPSNPSPTSTGPGRPNVTVHWSTNCSRSTSCPMAPTWPTPRCHRSSCRSRPWPASPRRT